MPFIEALESLAYGPWNLTDKMPFVSIKRLLPTFITPKLVALACGNAFAASTVPNVETATVCVCAAVAGLVRTTTLSVLARVVTIHNCDVLTASLLIISHRY